MSDYARNALLKTETGTVQCGARGLEVAIMIIVFTIVWGTGSNAISIAHDMDMLFCDNCINCDNDEVNKKRGKYGFCHTWEGSEKITLFFGVL